MPDNRRVAGDDGFSLAELTIAVMVFLMVMAVGWQMMFVGNQATTLVNDKAVITNEVSEPLDFVGRNLMQATSIEVATGYSLSFLTTRLDGERTRFVLDMTTASPTWKMYYVNPSTLGNAGLIRSSTFSKSYVNKQNNWPALRYYDKEGVEIADYADVPSKSMSVQLDFAAYRGGSTMRQTKQVFLRNMFGY